MILVNGRNVNFTNFPDGTSSFRFGLEAGTCNISWKYDNDAECMHLLYLVKHLRAMGIDDLYLNMPYIPNARMDRVKNSDEVFTLKWFADFINSLNFRLVRVLDPHSNVATALINNVKVMDVKYYINQPIQFMVSQEMNPLLCYPDEGAAKRYSEMIPMEYVFCIKHRDWRTGKIERTELTTFAIDGDEVTHIRRLLKEIYPHQNFSMVSDSYDYWNLVNVILPEIKEDVLAHDGCLAVRGDSGDPVQIVTQTVFKLWDIFGGTVNSRGFKVLNPHVKALYGDSITPQRCERIYQILMNNGFAINNVSLGVGSFSMQCLEHWEANPLDNSGLVQSVQYASFTRDTFGIAVKATYAKDIDGKSIMIFKNPKTDSGHFKKSQRGCCRVSKDGDEYTYEDGLTWEEAQDNNELKTVFKNGKLLKVYTLDEVRQNLHGGDF